MGHMSREAQLELARHQQQLDWKRTKKSLAEFSSLVRKHLPEKSEEMHDIESRLGLVADLDSIPDVKPEEITERESNDG